MAKNPVTGKISNRKYKDKEKGQVLALLAINDGNQSKTCRQVKEQLHWNLSERTIRRWIKEYENGELELESIDAMEEELGEFTPLFRDIVVGALTRAKGMLEDPDIKIPYKDLVLSGAIGTDKIGKIKGLEKPVRPLDAALDTAKLPQAIAEAVAKTLEQGLERAREAQVIEAQIIEEEPLQLENKNMET